METVETVTTPGEYLTKIFAASLLLQKLEILAKLANNSEDTEITDVKYSHVTAKQITITLDNDKKINIVAATFVK